MDSFARPGGRLTGVGYFLVTDLTAKRLEILKEILPNQYVVTFYNPGDLIAPGAAKLAREEAGRLGAQVY